MSSERPLRILHCLHSLYRGGIETWLCHLLRSRDRDRFQMDFVVATDSKSDYDEEFRRLGASIIPCLYPMRPWQYGPEFSRLLKQHGPYDVVHSHFDPCGYPLLWAHRAGVPVRIAHSHTTGPELKSKARIVQTMGRPLTRHWIRSHATGGLGVSEAAAQAMFGTDWQSDERWKVLYCGTDLSQLNDDIDCVEIRSQLGIPNDALVLGHVGRLSGDDVKNHIFLVDVAAEVLRRNGSTHLVLIGEGPLRGKIESRVAALGLSNRIHLLGARSDVLRLLKGAVDVFVFPSRYEGLPLAMIEAQAAGLPCVVSDGITDQTDVVKPLITRVSLSQPASAWADVVMRVYTDRQRPSAAESFELVARSPFNIEASCQALQDYYLRCMERSKPSP